MRPFDRGLPKIERRVEQAERGAAIRSRALHTDGPLARPSAAGAKIILQRHEHTASSERHGRHGKAFLGRRRVDHVMAYDPHLFDRVLGREAPDELHVVPPTLAILELRGNVVVTNPAIELRYLPGVRHSSWAAPKASASTFNASGVCCGHPQASGPSSMSW